MDLQINYKKLFKKEKLEPIDVEFIDNINTNILYEEFNKFISETNKFIEKYPMKEIKETNIKKENLINFVSEYRIIYDEIINIVKEYSKNKKDIFVDINENCCEEVIPTVVISKNPLHTANKLINLIYEKTKSKVLSLITVIEFEQFSILFSGVRVINSISLHDDSIINSYFIDGVPIIPPELYCILAAIRFSTFSETNYDIENYENKKNEAIERYKSHIKTVGGNICENKMKDIVFQIKLSIIDKVFKDNSEIAIVGQWAYLCYYGHKCINYSRVQIISSNDFESIYFKVNEHVNKYYSNYSITVSESRKVKIPGEFNLSTRSIKISSDGNSHQLIEYINICNYKVIPVVNYDGILLGCKMFNEAVLFYELWVLFNIYSSESISDKKYINANENCLNYINSEFLEADGLLGYFLDEIEIYKTNTFGKDTNYYQPYIPYSYFLKNKTLRNI